MNRNHRITPIVLSAAIAAAALGATSAHAGCVDPGSQATSRPTITLPVHEQAMAKSDIAAINVIGTWLVTYYDSQGEQASQAYIQWHSDGTEWENVALPISDPMCLGSWKPVDRKHVSRNHFGWLFSNTGLTGYFNETETATVGRNGTYKGVTDTKVYDVSGNLLGESTGTSSAVKISP